MIIYHIQLPTKHGQSDNIFQMKLFFFFFLFWKGHMIVDCNFERRDNFKLIISG